MDSSDDRTNEIQDNGDSPSSGSSNESTSSSAVGKTGKIAVIAITVLIAGTLAAHSLLTDNKCGSAGRCGGSLALLNAAEEKASAPACPPGDAYLNKAVCGDVKTCPFEKAQDCPQTKSSCPKPTGLSDAVGDCPLTKTAPQ